MEKEQIKTPRFLLSEDEIKGRIKIMADEINHDYQGKDVTAICILKGGMVFFTDLIRFLKMPLRCEFLATSSYGNDKKSSGEVKLTMDTKYPLEGKHVLVVEDIVDSGLTLSYILALLKARNPASVKLCSLLFKPASLKRDLTVDYVGFKIGNEFVVGYGLDYAGLYRNLPYVGVLEE
ncbi:MAG: hypoxanthine phosphoribosyltransferase [Deltaproteobacteria bacterium]|nr:hypoxanthine phosphoribosyltransferase [Deltaproteobacteria bacterium]